LKVSFKGVEMTSVTPYSGRFAGYKIEKGKLSIDVAYLVENRTLNAKQKFVIDQLELGERVESADAVHLPLKLAVALLKDRNGVIDIDRQPRRSAISHGAAHLEGVRGTPYQGRHGAVRAARQPVRWW
jgi:hypothetical protein